MCSSIIYNKNPTLLNFLRNIYTCAAKFLFDSSSTPSRKLGTVADMSKGSGGGNRLSRCIKAPMRALCSARDWYVRGITACAGQVGQYRGAGISYPSYAEFTYNNSFSSSSSSSRSEYCLDSDDGLRQLIRATTRARRAAEAAAKPGMRRSQSVVAGRIDEDKPCEFKDSVKVGSSLIFPRSSSHGAGRKRRGSNIFA